MPRQLGPPRPSCLGIWVPSDPKWVGGGGGTRMPVTPVDPVSGIALILTRFESGRCF